MRQTLSNNAVAVLILLNAQRHVQDRFDGSWWLLDFAKWAIVPTLPRSEHDFILSLIDAGNRRRSDFITLSNRPGITAA